MALCSSEGSLRALPQPYDISTAVSRTLRLSSSSTAGTNRDVARPGRRGPAYRVTAPDGGSATKGPGLYSAADSRTYSFETYFEDVQLEMEVEGWSSDGRSGGATEPHLDQFCRYLQSGDHDSSPESSPAKYSPGVYRPSLQQHQPGWTVRLENDRLWKQFDSIGTEMVITKNGRRMFPAMVLSISGLIPTDSYSVVMDIYPTDNKRYKFLQSEWVPVGRADKKQLYKQYVHPDSPSRGSFWMDKPVSFKLVKLTNNKNTKHDDQIILNSMQKYRAWITITCERDGTSQTYSFDETDFIAVTAYQNSQITQLKIVNNPYARAFRECIPSSDGSTPERKGGHYRLREQQQEKMPCPSSKRKRTSPYSTSSGSSASPSPVHPLRHATCPSAISVESGFESASSDCFTDPSIFPEPPLLPREPTYGGCPLNYWADDNSLYNPALITPPPQLDSSSSFSLPYLQQSSRMVLESAQCIVSPMKGIGGETLYIDVETVDDDDVFW